MIGRQESKLRKETMEEEVKPRKESFGDMKGKKFGFLTVIAYHHSDKKHNRLWTCRCDCGAIVIRNVSYLRRDCKLGRNPSCGCNTKRILSERTQGKNNPNWKHGMSKELIHGVWRGMKRRCEDPNDKAYVYYGARGVHVCPRWQSFKNFWADMGPTYKRGLSIDRIDVNKGYYPENCRWATAEQQSCNMRRNRLIKGVPVTVFARQHNLNFATVFGRLNAGCPIELLGLPIKEYKNAIQQWRKYGER